jgi:tol-pal system protein YbgF
MPPSSPSPTDDEAERLYKRALQEYQQNNYEVAIVLFKQYLRQYPKAPLAGNAQYWVGESLYAQKQYEAAIVAFDEVLRKYPDDSKVPPALLKQGYAFAELKDVRNARFFLQQVQQKYPNSAEAQQAAEKLKQLPR